MHQKRHSLKWIIICIIVFYFVNDNIADPPIPKQDYGQKIRQTKIATIWQCSSAYKIGKHWPVPSENAQALQISLAKNEYESRQLVITPKINLSNVTISVSNLKKSNAILAKENIDILHLGYVNITESTDGAYPKGNWPDPIFPIEKSLKLKANENHPFWVRIYVPKHTQSGIYKGTIKISSDKLNVTIPLMITIFNFALPDVMTCKSALGDRFSKVWAFHHLKSQTDKKIVADKYLTSFANHHISPYNCNPAGPSWQLIISIPDNIDSRLFPIGGEYVNNEAHTGKNSLIVFDQNTKKSICAESRKIYLPKLNKAKKLNKVKFSCWYRTLMPERMGSVWVKFYDKSGKEVKRWLTNFCGTGRWQQINRTISNIPQNTEYLKIFLHPAVWTVRGERTGVAWFDDVQIIMNGKKLINPNRSSFETSRETFTKKEYERLYDSIKVDLQNKDKWAQLISKAIDTYHFNTFYLWIKGMGGLTNSAINLPKYHSKQGRIYRENSIEYQIIFEKYIRQLTDVLKKYKLLDKAYVYVYDEPIDSHIPFVKRNYARLKKFAPELKTLMPTNKINPKLIGVIDCWVIIHYAIDKKSIANSNVIKWSYICCSPRAPYIGEFIDYPGIDLRLWLWQTFARNLKGILIWETLYWRIIGNKLENPYENPMSKSGSHGWNWGNGDGRLLYPPIECFKTAKPIIKGPIETIRWEMIRDGIEDYEYLTILKNLIQQYPQSKYSELLKLPKAIYSLRKHSKDPRILETLRIKIAKAIEVLTNQ